MKRILAKQLQGNGSCVAAKYKVNVPWRYVVSRVPESLLDRIIIRVRGKRSYPYGKRWQSPDL